MSERIPHVTTHAISVELGELEWGKCPFCRGLFAIDATYLDQVDTLIDCPMCKEKLKLDDLDGQGGYSE